MAQAQHVMDHQNSLSQIFAILVISAMWVFLTAGALQFIGAESLKEIAIDSRYIKHLAGYGYTYDVVLRVASDSKEQFGSRVQLIENGIALAQPHMPIPFISQGGLGAYRHEDNRVVFSSSDGSDPRSNDHTYVLIVPQAHSSTVMALVAVADLLLLAIVWAAFSKRSALRTNRWLSLGSVFLVLGVLVAAELAGRIALVRLFETRGQLSKALHDQTFGYATHSDIGWNALQYTPHPYVLYTLNPEAHRLFPGEINPSYFIRRREPIRSRDNVRLRILVLGGSTTFDNQILDERKTWVFRLETLLRNALGSDVDVINGGVGGYTIYENFIHYITLLTYLDPDVVLLHVGINDVHPRLYDSMRPDYGHYNLLQEKFDEMAIRIDRNFLRYTSLYRYMKVRSRLNDVVDAGVNGIVRSPYPPVDKWEGNLRDHPPLLYEQILLNLASLINAQGRKAAIIPQYFISRNEADRIFSVGVSQNNESSIGVGRKLNIPVFIGTTVKGAFAPNDTNDNCHFNEIGANKMADLIFRDLKQAGLTKPRLMTLRH